MFMNSNITLNRNLIWDYSLDEKDLKDEKILIFYIGRVLSHGTTDDVKQIPLPVIKKYLKRLSLPKSVFKFWQWYLSYVHPH